MPGRALIIRPGLVVGPHDYTNRFTYWLDRIARGGRVLAPHHPDTPVRFIDARDLADWTIQMAQTQKTGVYNASGKRGRTFGKYLETCRTITQSDAELIWVDENFLLEQEVKPWVDVPLWLPKRLQGLFCVNDEKAVDEGLKYRSVDTTLSGTLNWLNNQTTEFKIEVGMDEVWELRILRAWENPANR